jgi:hypothetical protein
MRLKKPRQSEEETERIADEAVSAMAHNNRLRN